MHARMHHSHGEATEASLRVHTPVSQVPPCIWCNSFCAGFVIGGPVLAAILAVAANYGSKRENEVGVAVRAVAKSAIDTFNFLSTINSKYDVTGETAWIRDINALRGPPRSIEMAWSVSHGRILGVGAWVRRILCFFGTGW